MNPSECSRLEEILAPIFPALKAAVLRQATGSLAGKVVLDLGGGTGQWLETFVSEPIREGILLDRDPLAVGFARHKWRQRGVSTLHGLIGSAEALPLRSDAIHLVLSRNSLHFWPDLPRALGEIRRVLADDGIVFIGRGFGPDLDPAVRETVKNNRKQFYETVQAVGDGNPSPDPEDLKNLAARLGFREVRIIPDAKSYWLFARKL